MKTRPMIKLAAPEIDGRGLTEQLKARLLERFGDPELRRRTVTLLADGLGRAAIASRLAVTMPSLSLWWGSHDRCTALAEVRREDRGCEGRWWLLARVSALEPDDEAFGCVSLDADDVADVRDAMKGIEDVERREPVGV